MIVNYSTKKITSVSLSRPNILLAESRKQPTITWIQNNKRELYTLIMYDPNSISKSGTFIHWLVINIPENNINRGNIILPYFPPTPPDNNPHYYTFELYSQREYLQ